MYQPQVRDRPLICAHGARTAGILDRRSRKEDNDLCVVVVVVCNLPRFLACIARIIHCPVI